MVDNLKKIENFVGEESLSRVYEVLGIFGMAFPETFNIYGMSWYDGFNEKITSPTIVAGYFDNYAIPLTNSKNEKELESLNTEELGEIGYYEFNDTKQELVFKINGVNYRWMREPNCEEFIIRIGDDINGKSIRVALEKGNKGIISSRLYIDSKNTAPVIFSYVNNAVIKGNGGKVLLNYPIDMYHELFKQLLETPSFFNHWMSFLHDERFINIIYSVFESPIAELVTDLKTNDQSWRFEKEQEKIVDDCEKEKVEARSKLDKVVCDANRIFKWDIHRAEDKKDARLQELASQAKEYAESKGALKH